MVHTLYAVYVWYQHFMVEGDWRKKESKEASCGGGL